jgi:hypothetical protein
MAEIGEERAGIYRRAGRVLRVKRPLTGGVDRNMFSAAERSVPRPVLPFRWLPLVFLPFIIVAPVDISLSTATAAATHRPRFPSWKDPAAINVNTASRCFPSLMASIAAVQRTYTRELDGLASLSDSPPRHRRSERERESLCADDSATDHTSCVPALPENLILA